MKKLSKFLLCYSVLLTIFLDVQQPSFAQHPSPHRLVLLPTAGALPERVTLGFHALPFPPTIVPQVTVPFGSSFGAFIYLGGGGYQKYEEIWALASVAVKYTPFAPDSSRFGVGFLGQIIAGGVGVSGGGGNDPMVAGGAIPTLQIIASTPVSRIQVHGGFAIHPAVGEDGWYTPFLGADFSALPRLHLLAEFFTFAPGSPFNQPSILGLGLRFTTERATYDVGLGLKYQKSNWNDESHYYWIPLIIAVTFKL